MLSFLLKPKYTEVSKVSLKLRVNITVNNHHHINSFHRAFSSGGVTCLSVICQSNIDPVFWYFFLLLLLLMVKHHKQNSSHHHVFEARILKTANKTTCMVDIEQYVIYYSFCNLDLQSLEVALLMEHTSCLTFQVCVCVREIFTHTHMHRQCVVINSCFVIK